MCPGEPSAEEPTPNRASEGGAGTSLPLRLTDRGEVNRNRARRLTGSLGSKPGKESNKFCLLGNRAGRLSPDSV